MKYLHIMKYYCIAILIAVLSVPVLGAQSTQTTSHGTEPLMGMSLNGSTGLYSIPSGRIGWNRPGSLGLDLGYHAIIRDRKATHIPKAALSFFKWVELSAAFDLQPNGYITSNKGGDFIGGLKIQFPFSKTAVALGGNIQALNMQNTGDVRYNAGQVYVAVTYAGQFFNMPAETSVVIGKTFRENSKRWDIDYGMGFDLMLFPRIFRNYAHWITDFANFSYSVESFSADAWYRGVLNTGIRVDLSFIPGLQKFKFIADIMMTDAFDDSRAFAFGVVFGIPIL